MEKATLNVSKSRKGSFILQAVFSETGKTMTIQNYSYPDAASLHGKEVEIERTGGQIKKVIYEGKDIFQQSQAPSNSAARNSRQSGQQNRGGGARNVGNQARAPYNFIPLNEVVIPSPDKPGAGDCVFDRYHDGRYTGHIELTVKTETPLYIRDTLTVAEMKKKEEVERDKKKNQKYINPDFFSPAGKICLPGSSVRGMIRTMVEIMSYSRMQFLGGDGKYHFRSFADKSLDLREQYSKTMLCGDERNGFYQRIKAGYLIKRGIDFFIIPARIISETQFFRIEEDDAIKGGVINQRMKSIDCYSCVDHKAVKSNAKGVSINKGSNLIEIMIYFSHEERGCFTSAKVFRRVGTA